MKDWKSALFICIFVACVVASMSWYEDNVSENRKCMNGFKAMHENCVKLAGE